jgi:hypothetical protein
MMKGLMGMTARSMTSSSTNTSCNRRSGDSKNSSLHPDSLSCSIIGLVGWLFIMFVCVSE